METEQRSHRMTAFSEMVLYGEEGMPMLGREGLPEKINKQTLFQVHGQQSQFLQTTHLINTSNLQNYPLRAVHKHAGFVCIKPKNNPLPQTAK